MPFAAVGAVIGIMGNRIGERKEIAAFPAFSLNLARRTGALLFLLFLRKLLLAVLAVIRDKIPGRINGKNFTALFAFFIHSGILYGISLNVFRFRFFLFRKQTFQFTPQNHYNVLHRAF